MARDATTIYVDDSSIRLLSVSGRRPRQWASEPLDAGLVRDGFVVDEPAVATRIRTLWAKEQPGSQRVIAGISGINCLYRFLTLPELPKNLMPEAIKREASRALGLPLDQLYISWQTLPGKPGETLVYVAAAARTTVDSIIRTLKRANLNPYMMDIAPLALARSTAESSALIVDLQPAGMDIVVKMGGMPEVIRSVSVSRASSINDRLGVVRQELQRAVTFFNSSHPDAPLADDVPILVAGELGERTDLWQGLLGRIERRVEALQSPLEAPAQFSPFLYAPLIGLALKQTQGKASEGFSRINFNALPEAFIPKPRPISELLFPPALLVGALAVAALGYMVFNAHALTSALRDRAEANNQLVTTLGAEVSRQRQSLEAEKAKLQADAAAREARASALDDQLRSFSASKTEMNGDLGEIHRTPGGVHLNTITYGSTSSTVTGWGESESAVFAYARQLRNSGKFTLVVLTSMTTEDVQTAFTLALTKK
jgi:type IV pilus assembly protein PilM